jgi:hypothetical protein
MKNFRVNLEVDIYRKLRSIRTPDYKNISLKISKI